MKGYKKIFIITFLLASVLRTMQAQVPFFKMFQVDKERSEIRIQRMVKDQAGYLWLGTSEGLYKFNGVEFSKINNDLIHDSAVTALFEDSRRRLWIGFKSGKIATLENNILKLFTPQGKLPGNSIYSILEDHESRIWFATNGEGVYYYAGNKLHNISSRDGLNDDYTYSLALTSDGSVWIGTDQGIGICQLQANKPVIKKLTSADGLPDNIVSVLLPDSEENMWIGMQDKGVCKYLVNKKSFFIPSSLQNWPLGQVNCLMETENHLWIGTANNGIVNYDMSQEHITLNLTTGFNVRLSKINDLLEDNEFNVWIANNNQLVRSSGEQISFLIQEENKKPEGAVEEKKSEQFKLIHSILYDRQGRLWFTPDQGLIKL